MTGVAGQRASRKGELDGYRVWPRDARDLVKRAGPSASPTPSPSSGGGGPGPTASPAAGVITIAEAVRRGSGAVVVEGLVTAPSDLLDATGRRIVVEDRTAGLEILLPADAAVPPVGARIRAAGQIGRAYDAPRLRADALNVLAVGGRPLPLTITSPPTAAHEWRLVVVSGVVADVHKLGDRWRAELSVGRDTVVVNGLAGAADRRLVGRRGSARDGRRHRPAAVPRSVRSPLVGRAARARRRRPGRRGCLGRRLRYGRRLRWLERAGSATGGTGVGAAVDGPTVPDVDLVDARRPRRPDGPRRRARRGARARRLPARRRHRDRTGRADRRGGRLPAAHRSGRRAERDRPGRGRLATSHASSSTDAAGLVRVGDLTAASAPGAAGPPRPRRRRMTARPPRAASPAASLGPIGLGSAGVAGIVAISGLSLVVTVLRRRRARRLLAVRVGARLAGIAAPSAAAPPG